MDTAMSPYPMLRWRSALSGVVGCIALSAHSATPLAELRYNPDITTALGAPAVTVSPGNIVSDQLAGPLVLIDIASVPAGANVTAYHRLNNGDALVVTDTTVVLTGSTFEPRDAVRYNGTGYSAFFAGATNAIPDGARIVGLALVNNTDPLLAFDTTVVLSGIAVHPTDIARCNGNSYIF